MTPKEMLKIANSIPEDIVINKLIGMLNMYRVTKDKNLRKSIHATCSLFVMKYAVDNKNGIEGVVDAFEEFNEFHKLREDLTTDVE